MDFQEVMQQLEAMGNEQTKKTLTKHGAREPFFGVKVGDLKKIVKKVKKDHELSLELYQTGNSDAMYLAGLIADEKQISKAELQDWVKNAYWYYIAEYAVPWVAAESQYGWELAMEWIDSEQENIASAGWATLSSIVNLIPNDQLSTEALTALIDRVNLEIHSSKNRVRYTMNGFLIAVGGAVPELTEKALTVADEIGKVNVDVGGTACKVPFAPQYIDKIKQKGQIGKKRKSARC